MLYVASIACFTVLNTMYACGLVSGYLLIGSWEATQTATLLFKYSLQHKILNRLHPPPRLRDTHYIARCCCCWPLLLLPVLQGASRTPKTTAWGAMAEVFSDDLNLKIGDLLSRPLSSATCPTCARPFMLTRTIQAHTCMFARAPV